MTASAFTPAASVPTSPASALPTGAEAPDLVADAMLYRRFGTYAEVAKRTGIDPRTSRKYVEEATAR